MYYVHNIKDNEYSLYSNEKNILNIKGSKEKFIKYIKIFDKTIEGNKCGAKDTKICIEYKKNITIN